jgi:uncharacterized membrane protein
MKKSFFTGLVILLPVVITVFVVSYIVNLCTYPFLHIFQYLFETNNKIIVALSKVIILCFLVVFIWILGVVGRYIAIRSVVSFGDWTFHKIPIINKIYKIIKDIVKSIFASDAKAFTQVVLVPFPQKDSWILGLVSGKAPCLFSDSIKTELTTVFVPTTPSPISGFLLMYKPQDLIYLDMNLEQAFKYIVSCGVVGFEEEIK